MRSRAIGTAILDPSRPTPACCPPQAGSPFPRAATVGGEPTLRAGRRDPWQQAAKAGRGRGDPRQQLGLVGVLGELAESVDHGEVGEADVAELDGRAHEHPHPTPPGAVGKRQQQAGLAHPGVSGEQDDLRLAALGPLQGGDEPAQLHGPADER
jgi:hypothetical protein